MTLNAVYNETGIRFQDFVNATGLQNPRAIRDRLVDLVKMYSKPDKLDKLVKDTMSP